MNHQQKLQIYHAQTQNVQALVRAWKVTMRSINHSLRKGDSVTAKQLTKVLALIFCAWAEAMFSKMIHTPYGFAEDEIVQIKQAHLKSSLEAGWTKCVELALQRVASRSCRSSYVPNIKQKLHQVIRQYVHDPRIIRNKIAHGQWIAALNADNTAVNPEISHQIRDLDVVTLEIWHGVFGYLAQIIECLIESPDRAFHRDYWVLVAELQQFLDDRKDWTLASKIDSLRRKPIYHG
jgi:hypothetical protein